MNENNQNTSTCQNGEGNKCGCKMCQKWGWCPAGKWHKILKIVLWVIVIAFIVSFFVGGHEGNRNDNKVVNTITVSGTGEVVVTPDIATISFGVTSENLDVAKAQNDSAVKMNNIIDLLKTKGVDKKDIKLTNYNIYPRYNYVNTIAPQGAAIQSYNVGGKQVLAAYVVSQTVEVKIRDISKAGEILSGVGEFGVTDVSGLTFTVDNDQTLKDQARDLAIQDAKAQAQVLAKGLGVKLVKITSFSESGNTPVYYAMDKAVAMSASAPSVAPQVPVGENKITSNVNITYEIR